MHLNRAWSEDEKKRSKALVGHLKKCMEPKFQKLEEEENLKNKELLDNKNKYDRIKKKEVDILKKTDNEFKDKRRRLLADTCKDYHDQIMIIFKSSHDGARKTKWKSTRLFAA